MIDDRWYKIPIIIHKSNYYTIILLYLIETKILSKKIRRKVVARLSLHVLILSFFVARLLKAFVARKPCYIPWNITLLHSTAIWHMVGPSQGLRRKVRRKALAADIPLVARSPSQGTSQGRRKVPSQGLSQGLVARLFWRRRCFFFR